MPGVFAQSLYSIFARLKEYIIQRFRIIQTKDVQYLGQCKYTMKVLAIRKAVLACINPPVVEQALIIFT